MKKKKIGFLKEKNVITLLSQNVYLRSLNQIQIKFKFLKNKGCINWYFHIGFTKYD